MPLVWQKLVDCPPDVPDCDCPEPAADPEWEGQVVLTDCGGSSSSSSDSSSESSESSDSSDSSAEPPCEGGWCIYSTTNSEPDGSGTWSWVSLYGNGAGWFQAPCYGGTGECACQPPTMSAAAAVAAYGTGRFYTVACGSRAILYYA